MAPERQKTNSESMTAGTSTWEAPWYIVPADDKENARLIVSQIIVDALKGLTNPRVKDVASFSPIPPILLGYGRLLCDVFAPQVSNIYLRQNERSASGLLQLGGCAREVLRLGRDASVAVNHVAILHQNFASEKPQAFSD
jgi:hypothetical protein